MSYDIFRSESPTETTLRSMCTDRFVFEIFKFYKMNAQVFLALCPNIKHHSHEKHVNNFVNSKFRQISCQPLESAALYLILHPLAARTDDEIHFSIRCITILKSFLMQSFLIIIIHNLDQTDLCHFYLAHMLAHAKFLLKIKSLNICRLQI